MTIADLVPPQIRRYIDGRVVTGRAQCHGDVFDPATGRVTGHVDCGEQTDVAGAVRVASASMVGGRRCATPKRRTDSSSRARFSIMSPHSCGSIEEIFGPVLSIVRATSLEESIALIHDHEFGNGDLTGASVDT